MENELTHQDKQKIEENIRGKYVKVAVSPEGLFRYPTGRAGLEALNYDPDMVRDLPEPVAVSYCGVGNPFTLGPIQEGEAVLDVGCGAGVDSLVAARLVGPQGRVVGLDVTPEMIQQARANLARLGWDNVSFEVGNSDNLPFPDDEFDVVISNGVFNLIIDKEQALREVFRVLKGGGRLLLADMILIQDLPADQAGRIDNWYQ